MPCDEIRTYQVEAGQMALEPLVAALETLGWSPVHHAGTQRVYFNGGQYNRETGKMELPYGEKIETVKRAYSHEVVKQTAKRMGWQVQRNPTNYNRVTLKRRS